MRIRHTTESFIGKALSVHGNKYDYTATKFINSSEKIVVTCPLHGDFSQAPYSHLGGKGCPHCAGNARGTAADFISLAKTVHGDTYDYSLVEYVSGTSKVRIVCGMHGEFLQTPVAHVRGKQGCPSCRGARISKSKAGRTDAFVVSATKIHGEQYNYDRVDYVRSFKPVDIVCAHHGVFSQTPNAHLSGKGCKACNTYGFSYDMPATLYILSCSGMIKVGITLRSPEVRACDVSRSYGEKFSVDKVFEFQHGVHAAYVEAAVLRDLRCVYNSPKQRFDGYTECFINSDIEHVLKCVHKHSKVFAHREVL